MAAVGPRSDAYRAAKPRNFAAGVWAFRRTAAFGHGVCSRAAMMRSRTLPQRAPCAARAGGFVGDTEVAQR